MPRLETALIVLILSGHLAVPVTGAEAAASVEEESAGIPGTGIIRGKVGIAGKDGAVAGAKIRIPDSSIEAESGQDGRFRLEDVPEGRQEIEVEKDGFAVARTFLEVQEGKPAEVEIALTPPEEGAADTVGVAGKRPKTSTGAVIKERSRSGTTTVGIGEKDMKQLAGASNAANIASKLPGTHAVDGKYVYVRGLGERYSQTLVNGSSIPSPEPDKRVIPLDLFPANLLESINIAKTYSPDMPGEFSGGSVLLRTKDIPEEDFLTLGTEAKYRQDTTFRDFKTYHGGNLDMFSFDDGTRSLPREVPPVQVSPVNLDETQLQAVGRSFPNVWEPDVSTAPFDHKLSLSGGKRIGQPGVSSLGIVGSLNWANNYQTVLDEARRLAAQNDQVYSSYKLDTYTQYAELSGLLGLAWEIEEGQKVGVRTLYTRSSDDQVRQQEGLNPQASRYMYVNRLRWVERSLFTVQPYGEHLLAGDTVLEWRLQYGLSQRDEPDKRQTRYDVYPDGTVQIATESAGYAQRDFLLLDENIYDAEVDYSIPFRPFGVEDKVPDAKIPEQRIKLGPALLYRDRSFDRRRFYFQLTGRDLSENGTPIDRTGSPEDIFRWENINPDGVEISEATRSSDNYEADQTILAGYAMADFRIVPTVRLITGVRVENSVQNVEGIDRFPNPARPEELQKTELNTTDPLPTGTVIWEFFKDMQLRAGASQTVSRPEFRELAQFEYSDLEAGYIMIGNPDLDRAKVLNADLAWEWFPSARDLVTVGLFYKRIDQPIEMVVIPASSSYEMTWQNADRADLFGVELEGRKNLGFLNEVVAPQGGMSGFEYFSLVGNLSLIQSEVVIPPEQEFHDLPTRQTNDKRPLQGQSKYLFNLGLVFEDRPLGLTAGVYTSTFGERLSAIGTNGVDDEYEQPRWSLDVKISKTFGKSTVTLIGENLLDDNYEYKVGSVTTREYRRGWVVGLAYSYSF